MSDKVLLVDDDRSLLNTLERNLGFDFDVTTAGGGEVGLESIESAGPFPVVVVDMRMPGMDGIQTIKAIRNRKPDTVFVMLTGNQDNTTAVQAVNEGNVFRYLNKPCSSEEIKIAIQEAHSHYRVKISDKEMLVDTMMGSINLLTEIAQFHSSRSATPEDVHWALMRFAERLKVSLTTEDTIAARVLLTGLSLLTDEERARLTCLVPASDAHQSLLEKLCDSSARIVVKLPRFARIADILRMMPSAASLDEDSSQAERIACLLRIAFYWSSMTQAGKDDEVIFETLRNALPGVSKSTWRMLESDG